MHQIYMDRYSETHYKKQVRLVFSDNQGRHKCIRCAINSTILICSLNFMDSETQQPLLPCITKKNVGRNNSVETFQKGKMDFYDTVGFDMSFLHEMTRTINKIINSEFSVLQYQ